MILDWFKKKRDDRQRYERKEKRTREMGERVQERVNLLEQTMRDLKPCGK